MSRGIKNNNPCNLIKTNINWLGKIEGKDRVFETFKSMEYGIRAAAIDIHGDITKKKKNTIRKVINEFAPPNENNTDNYINFVAKKLGWGEDEEIKGTEKEIIQLIKAIITIENGKIWALVVGDETIVKGVELANLNKRK